MNKIDDGMIKSGEDQLKRIEAMIGSMTADERAKPELLAAQPSRRRRVADGSGHVTAEVDKVLGDFQRMRGMMKQMSTGGGFPGMGGLPGVGPESAGLPSMGGGNQYQSRKAANGGTQVEQETEALNIAYTVGGLTLGFQDAKTTNAGYTAGTDDDTRTISIKTAF